MIYRNVWKGVHISPYVYMTNKTTVTSNPCVWVAIRQIHFLLLYYCANWNPTVWMVFGRSLIKITHFMLRLHHVKIFLGSWFIWPTVVFVLLNTLKSDGNIYSTGINLGQAQQHGRTKPVNGITTTTCTDSPPFKKTTYQHKNEWQHKHWQYNSRFNEYV